ncbi:C1 family peptidase [Devriesea agamarum]|uniref:lectin like domain-containing protein n=1 Tax=Devriesea agamarum TaxID=472569 RepID=UPI00071DD35C|nr:lectin like domain-containing protein [Devriesea agamarum]
MKKTLRSTALALAASGTMIASGLMPIAASADQAVSPVKDANHKAQGVTLNAVNPKFTAEVTRMALSGQKSSLAGTDKTAAQLTREGKGAAAIPNPVTTATSATRTRSVTATKDLPERYDLREHNKLTPVRNQGPNGSCWAFAAMATAESFLMPGDPEDFSEANMRNTHGFDWGPEQGGNRSISTAYLARWSGPIAEKDDPYQPKNFVSPKGLKRVKDLYEAEYVPDQGRRGTNLDPIKEAVYTSGAVETTINGNENGVFNRKTAASYNPGYGQSNHAVAIVGWDDNYSASNFLQAPPGNGAWIVRNSWGANWPGSDKGYYYVSYYDAFVGQNNVVYKTRNTGTSDNIFQYDPLGMTSGASFGKTSWFSNVFSSDKNQSVNGAGFYTTEPGVTYEIYVNPKVNGSLMNSNLKPVAKGTIKDAGYHVINFNPVPVTGGSYFAPIVKVTSPSGRASIPLERPVWGFASRATAQSNQSFVSGDGSQWSDATRNWSNTNVALKAFTVNAR